MTEIFYSMDHILFLNGYNDPKKHRHWSKHLLISLDGEIQCFIENQKICCTGIMISSNVYHTIDSNQKQVLVYLFDETTDISKEMDLKYLNNSPYYIITKDTVEKIKTIWNEKNTYHYTYKSILKSCNLQSKTPHIKDDRIKEVIKLLKNKKEITKEIINDLSESVYLSPSRLSHLFKEETKISLNSYLVIMKVSKTYEYILKGDNITDACLKAGFYSASHFATTNKNMFGLCAKSFQKDIKFIEVC
ncbi:helix-turn-helix domain-containing protein [Clostridium niameyense]|uniref:Helix-turn-helix domain-containing protein n=1 Tax=Clostridium niameyense TaxID=1622073 RepID=A0A6M0R7K7_9CLOT|nr:helix-turn-helix domain-containing protein [Clostridium niameyense]NEZ46154.1 helix-turn-helix domain-containing protein [Clostridium niameyense]